MLSISSALTPRDPGWKQFLRTAPCSAQSLQGASESLKKLQAPQKCFLLSAGRSTLEGGVEITNPGAEQPEEICLSSGGGESLSPPFPWSLAKVGDKRWEGSALLGAGRRGPTKVQDRWGEGGGGERPPWVSGQVSPGGHRILATRGFNPTVLSPHIRREWVKGFPPDSPTITFRCAPLALPQTESQAPRTEGSWKVAEANWRQNPLPVVESQTVEFTYQN